MLALQLAAWPATANPIPAMISPAPAGIRTAMMNPGVAPGTDFYRFASGGWHDSYRLTGDETYAGARPALIAQRRARIRAIVDDVAKGGGDTPVARIVGPFYASFLDAARIDQAGLRPAAADLARIRAINSYPALIDMFAQGPKLGLPAPITASIFYDFHAPGRLRYMVTPGGFALPQREMYDDASDRGKALRADYRRYAVDMLTLANEPDAATKADAALALEARLAAVAWPSRDARDFLKTANSLPVAALQQLTPDFDWADFMDKAGVGGSEVVIVAQPSAMEPLVRVIHETPLATWRAWAVLNYMTSNAPYLAAPIAQRRFDFFDRQLSGQQQPSPRWQGGIDLVERFFGPALGQLYVERYFPEANKAIVAAMFANIRAEMRQRIVDATWMGDTTRAEALRKVDTVNVKIGYPDRWPEYVGLRFDARDFYGNLRKARANAWDERARLVYAPLPADRWMTTAQASGAAANPNLNEVTVPAGALEPPYFSPGADAAVNYGAIGAIMGHELSHLFDQLGRQMDATGALRDWWLPADAARFEAIAARVVAQYGGVAAAPGLNVDGKITLNENIADIAGLDIAYGAYRKAVAGTAVPVIDELTGDQRFFLAWAQMRAGKMSDAMLAQQVASGPHAPDHVRGGQPMRNINAWYDAFSIKPGDPLYIPPASRARFW